MAVDIRLETEDMTLGGNYRVETGDFASAGEFIGLDGPTGTATTTFSGVTGIYDVVVGYYDEDDGESQLTVTIGGNQVDSWTFDNSPGGMRPGAGNLVLRTIATDLVITNGTTIEIAGLQEDGENSRVDYIDFVFKSAVNTAPSLTGTPSPINYEEDAAAVNVGITDLAVNDTEGNVTSARIEITGAEDTEELAVGVALPDGFTSNYLNGVLTINGAAPVATYTNILRNITYRNSDDTPPSSRTISFSVNDGEFDSNLLIQTVNITDIPEDNGGGTDGGGTDGGGTDGGDTPTPPAPGFSLTNTSTNLLGLEGPGGAQLAQFILEEKTIKGRFEVNVFKVDDEVGTIDGVSPDSADYINQALERSMTLFGTTGDGDIVVDSTRLFSMTSGNQYGFVILPGNTRDSFLGGRGGDFKLGLPGSGGISPLSLTFSDENQSYSLNWNLDDDALFDDLRMKVRLTGEASTILGSSFQGGFESEVIDLTGVFGAVELVFEVRREAKFDNLIGFYRTEDVQGTIRDSFGNLLNPGDEGYIQAAVAQWQNQPGITGRNGRTVTTTATVEGGSIWAPFIIVDGTISEVLDGNAANDPAVYFPYLGANSDGADHIVLLGDNTFGFEDLPNGGDNDFDDMVVTTTIRPIAA